MEKKASAEKAILRNTSLSIRALRLLNWYLEIWKSCPSMSRSLKSTGTGISTFVSVIFLIRGMAWSLSIHLQ